MLFTISNESLLTSIWPFHTHCFHDFTRTLSSMCRRWLLLLSDSCIIIGRIYVYKVYAFCWPRSILYRAREAVNRRPLCALYENLKPPWNRIIHFSDDIRLTHIVGCVFCVWCCLKWWTIYYACWLQSIVCHSLSCRLCVKKLKGNFSCLSFADGLFFSAYWWCNSSPNPSWALKIGFELLVNL